MRSFLLISAFSIVVWFFLRPFRNQQQNEPRYRNHGVTQLQRLQRIQPTTHNSFSDREDDGIASLLAANMRSPPHSSSSFNATMSHGGIIPFRFTLASTFESRLSKSLETNKNASGPGTNASNRQMNNRKERARIFTKLFPVNRAENSNATPPNRGSNIVVSVPSSEVDCMKLRHVLFLLGSYYNLFLLISLSKGEATANQEKTETDEYKIKKTFMEVIENKLRGTLEKQLDRIGQNKISLPFDVLPSHRIVASSSIGGRVAFVRQLPKRPELVIDYETDVRNELTRFGFAVFLYSKTGDHGITTVLSGIGKELLP